MKNLFLMAAIATATVSGVFAHQTFELVSSEKKAVKFDDLIRAEKERTLGKKDGSTLTFSEKQLRLVVVTGPEDDMLSYRIQGLRNPTLVVPSGAVIRVLFVNKDVDMKHDVRFGHVVADFADAPETAMTAGTTELAPTNGGDTMRAEEIVIKSISDGAFKYFCSVRGHANGGMWGNIVVGVKPENLKSPEKSEHRHSSGGNSMENMPGMSGPNHAETMESSVNIGDPMSRESSGTAWAPDSSPAYHRTKMYDDGGMLMLMGTAFARYTNIGSSRDASVAGKGSRSRVDAPSMFMAMYSRPLTTRSQLGVRAMVSLDPLIQRGYGYPLLYQSGEIYRGRPIHDRQHPHDLFSELAVTYSYKFNERQSFYIYAGYPGEPALGPPTFMHRQSAANNPDAPISHHWQDATHITWGVVTGGFSLGKAKIEASSFNGTEPDENRWNFDRPRLNSYSARFSYNPTRSWSFQISRGVLKNPEPAEPEIKILHKTTASAIYNKNFGDNRNFAATFVVGQNHSEGRSSNSALFEANYDFSQNAVFGRIEQVQKSSHDLVLDKSFGRDLFRVGSYSIGYLRDLIKNRPLDIGLGGMMTINTNPSALTSVYGGRAHGGWQIFMRIRFAKTS